MLCLYQFRCFAFIFILYFLFLFSVLLITYICYRNFGNNMPETKNKKVFNYCSSIESIQLLIHCWTRINKNKLIITSWLYIVFSWRFWNNIVSSKIYCFSTSFGRSSNSMSNLNGSSATGYKITWINTD